MLRRTLVAALAVIGVITLPALPAGARTPRVEQGNFTFPVDEADTELCGFPMTGNFTFEAGNRLTPAELEVLCGALSG